MAKNIKDTCLKRKFKWPMNLFLKCSRYEINLDAHSWTTGFVKSGTYTQWKIIQSLKNCCPIICSKMSGTGGHYVKLNKSDTERHILHVLCHLCILRKSTGTSNSDY
jgi:hypothetical protein